MQTFAPMFDFAMKASVDDRGRSVTMYQLRIDDDLMYDGGFCQLMRSGTMDACVMEIATGQVVAGYEYRWRYGTGQVEVVDMEDWRDEWRI